MSAAVNALRKCEIWLPEDVLGEINEHYIDAMRPYWRRQHRIRFNKFIGHFHMAIFVGTHKLPHHEGYTVIQILPSAFEQIRHNFARRLFILALRYLV